MTKEEAVVLQAHVEECLKKAYEKREEISGPVNWADLHCTDVVEYRSVLYDTSYTIKVCLEEAGPEATELQQFVRAYLLVHDYDDVIVETEW